MLSLDTIDITDEQSYAENGYPWREWDFLRREAPVFWYRRPGFEPFWALTKHEDMAWVSRSPEIFSSAQRVSVNSLDIADMFAKDREQRAALLGHDPAEAQSLTWMDPPLHHQIRQIMSPAFMPKAMAALEDRFSTEADALVEEFLELVDERGSADVANQLAAKLPVAAICELLGVPVEDREKLYLWTVGTMSGSDEASVQDTFMSNVGEIMGYLTGLVQQRMADGGSGGTDVVSRLAAAVVEDRKLPFSNLLNQTSELLFAGNGTTRNVIAGGIRALLEHPDELRKLREDPGLLDAAVEEILRWTSVAVHMARTCVQDTEIRGQRIRAGETVAMFFPSANRDEDVFEDPYRFDITRPRRTHFAFGALGAHFCLGSNLAKAQLRAMIRAVVPVLSALELDGEPDLVAPYFVMAEYRRLRVRRAGR
ncbi:MULTISPECIES: cytochrome P450 [unclassified Streptomyces]|uniref:cytochrome P450 n=1 Tax=unclassified Streptomyces TaxID=2593676 RepID=UPI0033D4184D